MDLPVATDRPVAMDRSSLDRPNFWAASIRWMMLDRFVFTMEDECDDNMTAFMESVGDYSWERSMTSLKEYFAVRLWPAAPPAVSRLCVQWASGEGKSMEVLTADRGLFLLRVTTSTDFDTFPYRHDYFVFRASVRSITRSLLRPLPACTEPIVLPLEDGEVTMRRVFHNNTLGLVSYISNDEEFEFVVVQLAKFVDIPGDSRKNSAEICVFRSSKSSVLMPRSITGSFAEDTGKWEILTLPIDHKEEEFSDLQGWSTDGAITFDRTICWFDYYHGGILLYDLSNGKGEGFIQYARLPINNRPINSLPSDKKLEMYRSLSASGPIGRKELQFVDVVRDDGNFYGPLGNGYTFTITCHTMNPIDRTWRIYARTSSDELIRGGAHKLMPRNSVPTFPLVKFNDPRLIYFLMSEPGDKIDKVSVVAIAVPEQTIVSVTTYIQGDQDLCGKDAKMVRHRSRLPWSFLPFEPHHFFRCSEEELIMY